MFDWKTEKEPELFPPAPNRTPRKLLLAVAAPKEAASIRHAFGQPSENIAASMAAWRIEPLDAHVDLLETGVGKAQAAGAVGWAFDPAQYRGVLSIGIGGLLPGAPAGLSPGSAILATRSVFADEGGITPEGFQSIDAMGFPAGGFGETGLPGTDGWIARLRAVVDTTGWIATVSTCAGTHARAREIADRTGAIVENMEGAAVAATISRLPVVPPPGFAEIRIVSNTTGDRGSQIWDLPRALERLGTVARAACEALAADG